MGCPLMIRWYWLSHWQSNSPAPHASQNACPTLFVANLGPTCTEQELIQVFSRSGAIDLYLSGFYKNK